MSEGRANDWVEQLRARPSPSKASTTPRTPRPPSARAARAVSNDTLAVRPLEAPRGVARMDDERREKGGRDSAAFYGGRPSFVYPPRCRKGSGRL